MLPVPRSVNISEPLYERNKNAPSVQVLVKIRFFLVGILIFMQIIKTRQVKKPVGSE